MNSEQFLSARIPIVEIFTSISGEGITQGEVVTFVRTAGCNLRCSYCDTTYSYDEKSCSNEYLTAEEIVDRIESLGCSSIICTGGEPLEQGKAKSMLPYYLASKGYTVRVETNGSCPIELNNGIFGDNLSKPFYVLDIKCPGSGMSEFNIFDENFIKLKKGDELKFVMADKRDIDYALDVIDKYSEIISEKEVVINFSSVFEKLEPKDIAGMMVQKNKYFVKKGLKTRLSLQIHKFIWKPETRGV